MRCNDCNEDGEIHPKLLVCLDCIHAYWLTIYGTRPQTDAERARVAKLKEEMNHPALFVPKRKKTVLTDSEVEELRRTVKDAG